MDAMVTDVVDRAPLAGIRGLGREGLSVVAVAPRWRSGGLWSRYASARRIAPDPAEDPVGFASAVADAVRVHGPLVVYPGREESIDALLGEDRRGPPAVPLPWRRLDGLERVRDKRSLPSLASEAGLHCPRTLAEGPARELAAADVPLPCVVKPARIDGPLPEARLVSSQEELRSLLGSLASGGLVVVQEWIEGPLAAVSVVVAPDGTLAARFAQRASRVWPRGAGTSAVAVSVAPDEGLVEAARRLLVAAGYDGLAQLQFVLGPRGPALIDVNPRYYGSMSLALAAGVNLPAAWHAVVTGSRLPSLEPYRTGVSYHRLEADVAAAWRGAPLRALRRPQRPRAGALWASDDRLASTLIAASSAVGMLARRVMRPAAGQPPIEPAPRSAIEPGSGEDNGGVAAPRVEALLGEVARRVGDRAVLWRGSELGGSDVDVLVTDAAAGDLEDVLAAGGLSPVRAGPHHATWTGAELAIDVLRASGWPRCYPSLTGLWSRLRYRGNGLLPVTSPEDRLLILAAEAAVGRSLSKLRPQVEHLLATPGVGDRLPAVATAEGLVPLDRLVLDRQALRPAGRRGSVPWRRVATAAVRSSRGRVALAQRTRTTLRSRAASCLALVRGGRGGARGEPLLIAVSGMDGAGKSTAVEYIRRRLEAAGVPAQTAWVRLASDVERLEALARPVKRVLRRRGTTADPVAAAVGGRPPGVADELRPGADRRGIVSWLWICLLAGLVLRDCRQAVRRQREGAAVICDRWATDALVDLQLRYGRHRLAEVMLHRLAPRPHARILIRVDAATAAARKPDEVAMPVLVAMERRYRELALDDRFFAVDGLASREAAEQALGEAIDGVLAARRGGAGGDGR